MKSSGVVVIIALLSCFLLGCGDGGGETFPEVRLDPAEVATRIMAEFDADSDGELSKNELKKCKGLVMLTAGQEQLLPEYRLDKDGSGKISETEFAEKFTACFADLRQGYSCAVLYRGQPLPGATVTLVPEPFMGDVPSASGTTDMDGNCSVATEDGLEGAVPGIYKLKITHPEAKISSKYNTASIISIALDPTNPYAQEGVPRFNVK